MSFDVYLSDFYTCFSIFFSTHVFTVDNKMANTMISHIKKVRYDSSCDPIALAGYSAGGILAFEIAKQLTNTGHSVSILGLIDTYVSVVNPLSETEMFTTTLRHKFTVFKTIDD